MPRYICSTFPIAAYPRKGTITWTSSSRRRRKSLIAAYPRKGTITWTSSSRRRRKSLIAAYPRKGTITRRGLVCTDNHAIAAYPRKGTITQDEQSNQEHFDCSLSPQGDDNSVPLSLLTVVWNCSLSPQGDDNLAADFLLKIPNIAAYPRKGTITSHQSARRTTCTDCSLSPQGDDNLLMLIFFIIISYCSLSPQGGKKLRIKRCGVFLLQTLTFCFPWAVPL